MLFGASALAYADEDDASPSATVAVDNKMEGICTVCSEQDPGMSIASCSLRFDIIRWHITLHVMNVHRTVNSMS